MRQSYWLCLLAVLVVALFALPAVTAVQPVGATVTENGNQTAPLDAAGSQAAIAGNVSDINLYGYSSTQSWQGYYGNVSGTIQLADGSDHVLYNWSQTNPTGEVYSSTNSTISWLNVQCFNFTATGADNPSGETAGGTNQKGMNLTQLQNIFGINQTAIDSVNNTFDLIGGANDHLLFYTANLQFDPSECQTARLFTDSSGAQIQGHFEEVIQYEPTTNSVIWTSVINRNFVGFDDVQHDFEMLVPENGHGTDTATTTYYFYVEIE